MILSSMVAEWAAYYEREHGCKPAELVLQVIEHILKVGKMLKNLGQKDAQEGKKARPIGGFMELAAKAFRLDLTTDHDTVQAVAELWQSDYMDGYNTGEGSA